jgi:hypothetical protein
MIESLRVGGGAPDPHPVSFVRTLEGQLETIIRRFYFARGKRQVVHLTH